MRKQNQFLQDTAVLERPIPKKNININFHAVEKWVFRQLNHLSPSLTYHGKHHTSGVLIVARYLCILECVSPHETLLVKTAALFHDIGFLETYQNHEAKGCEMVRQKLPEFGYSRRDIARICEMIMATQVPQSPKCRLAEILCDADLDYLGREDFKTVGDSLVREWKNLSIMPDEKQWNHIQIRFLSSHRFFTKSSQKMRDQTKQKHINHLKKMVENI